MKIALEKYTYFRQYGPYTYFVNARTSKSCIFEDAVMFTYKLSRSYVDIADIVGFVLSQVEGVSRSEIDADVVDFYMNLITEGYVISDVGSCIKNSECGAMSEACHLRTPQEMLSDWFVENNVLVNLQIDITQACTERCLHCYIPDYAPKFLGTQQIFDAITWLARQGGIGLSVSGGECMLHKDFESILTFAAENGLMTKVFSNLTVCTENILKTIIETGAQVQASVYSMDPRIHDNITQKSGSWDVTMMWLRKLALNQVPCEIACPLMMENYKGFEDVREFARTNRFGFTSELTIIGRADGCVENLSHRLDSDAVAEVLEKMAEYAVRNNPDYYKAYFKGGCFQREGEQDWLGQPLCDACISSMSMDAIGNYHPCTAFDGVVLGNCYKDSIEWVWQRSRATIAMRKLRGRDIDKCVGCPDRPYCTICLCRNFNETKDMKSPPLHMCNVAAINRTVVERYRDVNI